jgi:hypothetical protein
MLRAFSILGADQFDPRLGPSLKATVDWLQSLMYPSGNFPAYLGDTEAQDKCVEFAHGATGAVAMLLEAFKLFKDTKY